MFKATTFFLRTRADTRGVHLEVGLPASPSAFELSLAVRPAWLRSSQRRPAWWAMTAGLPPARCRDSFRAAVEWLARRLSDPFPRERYQAFRGQLHELSVHAAGLCDPETRRLALRFRPRNRFGVYSLLSADSTGRLRQLVGTCPGTLLFLCAVRDGPKPTRWIASALVADLVRGARLDPALDRAVERWLDGRPRAGFQLPLFRVPGVYCRPPVEPASVLSLRQLLRRSQPLTSPLDLLGPLPPLALEDVPAAVRANAAWFRVMGQAAWATRVLALDDGLRDRFGRFVSKNAVVLSVLARRRDRTAGSVLSELLDYCRGAGRVPSRETSPERLLDESRRWHAHLATTLQREELLQGLGVASLTEVAFPAGPVPDLDNGQARIRCLGNAEELFLEGREMNHCVVTRILEVLEGRSAVYAARIGDERLTVELHLGDGGPCLNEIRGPSNAAPSRAALEALRSWMARRRPQQPGPSACDPS